MERSVNPIKESRVANRAADSKTAGCKPGSDRLSRLSLVAMGVVFGDIATSPLYAIRECFYGEYGIEVSRANVLGVLSLVFWALMMVVTLKYLTFVVKADNRGFVKPPQLTWVRSTCLRSTSSSWRAP